MLNTSIKACCKLLSPLILQVLYHRAEVLIFGNFDRLHLLLDLPMQLRTVLFKVLRLRIQHADDRRDIRDVHPLLLFRLRVNEIDDHFTDNFALSCDPSKVDEHSDILQFVAIRAI